MTLNYLAKVYLSDWAFLWEPICVVYLALYFHNVPCVHKVKFHFDVTWTSRKLCLEQALYLIFKWLPVWVNELVFVYQLSNCGIESYALTYQGVSWRSGSLRMKMSSAYVCNMTNTFTENTLIILDICYKGEFIFRILINTFWLSIIETVPNPFIGLLEY